MTNRKSLETRLARVGLRCGAGRYLVSYDGAPPTYHGKPAKVGPRDTVIHVRYVDGQEAERVLATEGGAE